MHALKTLKHLGQYPQFYRGCQTSSRLHNLCSRADSHRLKIVLAIDSAASSSTSPSEVAQPRKRGRPKKGSEDMQQVPESGSAPDDSIVQGGLTYPSELQQTLFKSFTLSGIGLHSGEYACIRVKPAFAGEGRYFVHVPLGSISKSFVVPGTEDRGRSSDPRLEEVKMELFQAYLVSTEEDGFQGNFMDFLLNVEAEDKDMVIQWLASRAAEAEWLHDDPEPIEARSTSESVWEAVIDNVPSGRDLCQRLVNDEGDLLYGTGILLSALEACGVENARIEVEGGNEIPILDGSALSWAMEIQQAGVRPAPSPQSASDGQEEAPTASFPVSPRLVLKPSQPVIVHDGDAFVSLMPDDDIRITVGIDHMAISSVIGKQWKSWSMIKDPHYRYELAGARTYIESTEEMEALRNAGFLKGATDTCMSVADGDRWSGDESSLRFLKDEPVRFAMSELIGYLALNAVPGHTGIPIGHIVAYKPNNDLNAMFVKALRDSTSEADWVDVMPPRDGEGQAQGDGDVVEDKGSS